MCSFPQSAPWFTPADDPKGNVWFSRDPGPIAKAYGLERVAPVIVDADATRAAGAAPSAARPAAPPRGGQTRVTLRNEHLQYALTWFGLALGLAGVFGVYAARRRG